MLSLWTKEASERTVKFVSILPVFVHYVSPIKHIVGLFIAQWIFWGPFHAVLSVKESHHQHHQQRVPRV